MIYFGYLLVDLYVFFLMYVASMGMVRVHKEKKINNVIWVLCVPFIILSLIVDFINNISVFAILFLDLPQELLVTERLKRYISKPPTSRVSRIRYKVALWLGEKILNPFDPTGNHLD